MFHLVIYLSLILLVSAENEIKVQSPISMIQSHGYPAEAHHVTTSDGYILELHRINRGNSSTLPPIFLQHGILCSSADFIVAGPKQGLAYILADAGYDVWMGNCRGNTYSRRHKRLKTFQRQFWNFSWHEMGAIDLPDMIDYVLNHTNHSSLHYVGHSQGTTIFFVMGSVRPEFNAKIRGAHLLAPAAFMYHMKSPLIRFFAPLNNLAEVAFALFGSGEVLASGDLLSLVSEGTCSLTAMNSLCSNLLFLFAGWDSDQFDTNLLPEIMKRTPAGTSVRQVLHFVQEVRTNKFAQYDFGRFGNMMRYGKSSPPDYDLGNVTAPLYLYYSRNDWFVDPVDVKRLKKRVPNVEFDYLVPFPKFNHMDFLWAKDVKEKLYDIVLTNIRRSDNKAGIK